LSAKPQQQKRNYYLTPKLQFMKTLLLFFLLSVSFCYAKAQVANPTPVKPANVTLKTIPSERAITIRKDTRNLQLQLSQLNDSLSIMKRKLDGLMTPMKTNLDSMGEMSQEEQLALQKMMEAIQQLYSTLSNIIKKMHDTQQAVINNLKG